MNRMEDQLVAYRARKAREQSEEASTSTGRSWFGSKMSSDPSDNKEEEDTATENTTKVFSYSGTSSDQPVEQAQASGWFTLPAVIANSRLARCISQDTSLLTNTLFLKFILWLALLGFFIVVQFVAVFVVLTLFYVMYANMRSDEKKPGEPSAYSVFNPNCERIDGSLTAEQFERELRFGPGAI